MPTITVSNTTRAFPPGTTAEAIFDTLFPARKPRPLAASLHGRARPLTWAPDADCALDILDYTQDEGRRVYERSLRFLFCLAMRRVLPDVRVRMEHSAGYGLYIEATPSLTEDEIAGVQAEMRALQAAELPFTRERWTREEAMTYFAGAGQADTVHLLGFRPYAFFDVYGCGGVYEYFYGDMLPSTAYLDTFALLPHAPGMVLQMPLPRSPQTVAPMQPRPKLMRAFAESAHWHDILGCRNVADLNSWVSGQKLREFVRVSEALQEKSIAAIADAIATRGARAVFISGPSSSGKTTFTHRLAVQLRVNGLRPVMLSLDNYYRNLQDVPLDEAGLPDLECLEALDVGLISDHLRALCRGEEVIVPRFSFHENQRKPGGIPMQVGADQPILIEGIHGLNPRLSAAVPREWVFRVYVSALTTLNLDDHNRIRTTDMRLLRRLVRDQQFRHAPFEETFAMWPSVRRGEERFIFPFQEEADVMFNSAVVYEAAVLKKYAYPTLTAIGDQSPYATAAQRLVKFLNYFQAADIEEELPPTAILREFIGGCSFYL
jgi:uridine kinase